MITFIIVDDDEAYLGYLKQCIEELNLAFSFEMRTYVNENQFMEDIHTFPKQSIFILDIVLKEMMGTELANRIHRIYEHSPIIFITAFLEKLTQVVDYPYCYFIYKPEVAFRLEKAIHKAMSFYQRQSLQIELKNKTIIIPVSEIMYIEHSYRISKIHTLTKEYKEYVNLSSYLDFLPHHFIQCHKSFIVNIDFVKEYHREEFILQNEEHIQISRSFSKKVHDDFLNYIKNEK